MKKLSNPKFLPIIFSLSTIKCSIKANLKHPDEGREFNNTKYF